MAHIYSVKSRSRRLVSWIEAARFRGGAGRGASQLARPLEPAQYGQVLRDGVHSTATTGTQRQRQTAQRAGWSVWLLEEPSEHVGRIQQDRPVCACICVWMPMAHWPNHSTARSLPLPAPPADKHIAEVGFISFGSMRND